MSGEQGTDLRAEVFGHAGLFNEGPSSLLQPRRVIGQQSSCFQLRGHMSDLVLHALLSHRHTRDLKDTKHTTHTHTHDLEDTKHTTHTTKPNTPHTHTEREKERETHTHTHTHTPNSRNTWKSKMRLPNWILCRV